MIDYAREVDDVVPGALNPGEEVLWTGHCLSLRGKQGKAGAAIGMPAATLAAMLAMIAGLSLCVVAKSPVFAILLGLATFVLTSAVAGRVLGEGVKDSVMYCRKQTVYVLTDQRAMVLRNCRTTYPVQSAPWAYVEAVRTTGVKPDGRGTVEFLSWNPAERRWVGSLRFIIGGNAVQVSERAIAARDAARG